MKSFNLGIAKWKQFDWKKGDFSLKIAALLMVVAGVVGFLTSTPEAYDDSSLLLKRGWINISTVPCFITLDPLYYYRFSKDETEFEFYVGSQGSFFANSLYSDLPRGNCSKIAKPNFVEEIKW